MSRKPTIWTLIFILFAMVIVFFVTGLQAWWFP